MTQKGEVMEIRLSAEDRKCIEESIRQKYARVSESPDGLFRYPTGQAGIKALKYDPKIIQNLPETILASYCGVGILSHSDRFTKGRRFWISVVEGALTLSLPP